jgi:hypothetical protein
VVREPSLTDKDRGGHQNNSHLQFPFLGISVSQFSTTVTNT